MLRLDINPLYQDRLQALGLDSPAALLALPGPIISGHPDRNVARVSVGGGTEAIPAYLKREHRVRWRTRWTNSWDGFGKVSRSGREAETLRRLSESGVGCPEWIAAGEDASGRAFLLVAALTGTMDLRRFLTQRQATARGERYTFARQLGSDLSRIHRAGIDHPDLLAKHVLVRPHDGQFFFLDWQRSRWWPELRRERRCHDLAVLFASLPEKRFSGVERHVCLLGYLAGFGQTSGQAEASELNREVQAQVRRLRSKRRIQAERRQSESLGAKSIYWLDGESLCVTSDLMGELPADDARWLDRLRADVWTNSGEGPRTVTLPGDRQALLVTARASRLFPWLWAELRGKPFVAPEVRQAGQIFRRQLQGEQDLRLLAFGQRCPAPWRTESFLLTETAAQQPRSSS